MIKAIVTGGCGFIGSNLVKKLVRKGWEVHIIDNLASGVEHLERVPKKVKVHVTDIRNLSELKTIFNTVKPEYVFHLAALPRVQFSIEFPELTHDVNVTGTMNVLLAAKDCGTVKKFVYSASSSAYGDQDRLPLEESMTPNPKSPYGLHKYVGEVYCKTFSQVFNLPTISLRYFNVYGPGQSAEGAYALVIAKFFKQVAEGKPMTITGDGRQTRDFTHVSDVVNANILAAESELSAGEVLNIGYGNNVSVNRIAELIGGPTEYVEARLEPKDTLASNFRAMALLKWVPRVKIDQGIAMLKEEAKAPLQAPQSVTAPKK